MGTYSVCLHSKGAAILLGIWVILLEETPGLEPFRKLLAPLSSLRGDLIGLKETLQSL